MKTTELEYDLIIIGGGIQGAALLWEAAHRGLRTLLLEQHDFANGASANSLKTIHGGIRYLQDFDFKRVKESSAERAALLRIAPHLVKPLPCILPASGTLKHHPLLLRGGALLYNLIARKELGSEEEFPGLVPTAKMLSRRQLQTLCPQLEQNQQGALYWFDAQVQNSERLALDFILSAIKEGADALNYHQVTEIETEETEQGKQVTGVIAHALGESEAIHFRSHSVIDCSSGWQLARLQTRQEKQPHLLAVNLLLEQPIAEQALALRNENGHTLFLAPWQGRTIAGTWYFPFKGAPDPLTLSEEQLEQCLTELSELLEQTNQQETSKELRAQLLDLHLGLLPASELANEQEPEKTLLNHPQLIDFTDQGWRGLYALQSNKLTTARLCAETILNQIAPNMAHPLRLSLSSRRPLIGDDWPAEHHLPALPERVISHYGALSLTMTQYLEQDPSLLELVPGCDDLYQLEVVYCTCEEMVICLSDLLYRRLTLGRRNLLKEETIAWCAQKVGELLKWSPEQKDQNIKQVNRIEQQRRQLREAL